ncbi:heme-binding protein [Pusillimonas sp. SM2304]|uniref:GlcG/HbpS family heme-binding protein n=1 Tax=Pusillimonas sp. SM2304 TaxID=3073241 RepID=UPI0028755115|nr:heme-binding protein [Pusillimonas sp. SM2304]MDS1142269.1 heme-binding protein [Pusillimonas sp. SM2304]
MKRRYQIMAVLGLACFAGSTALAAETTYASQTLTTEAALEAAKGALESCRKSGYQVAVSVTDRSGTPIAVLRDRYAGAHTPETATRKAYTSAGFRMPSGELAEATQAGKPTSGIRHLHQVLALGGGLPIEAAGSLVGAIGVSGAPGGDADETCAQAGIAAIQADLDFQ